MGFRLRRNLLITDNGYATALLDQTSGTYLTLDPAAALLVQTLAAGGSTETAVRELTDRYEVDEPSAERDVADLLIDLCLAGLVER
jgi:hypothetical protein